MIPDQWWCMELSFCPQTGLIPVKIIERKQVASSISMVDYQMASSFSLSKKKAWKQGYPRCSDVRDHIGHHLVSFITKHSALWILGLSSATSLSYWRTLQYKSSNGIIHGYVELFWPRYISQCLRYFHSFTLCISMSENWIPMSILIPLLLYNHVWLTSTIQKSKWTVVFVS